MRRARVLARVGLAAAVAALLALVVLLVPRTSGSPDPDAAAQTASAAAAATGRATGTVAPAEPARALGDLLAARSAALVAGDVAGWLDLLDPADPDLRATETARFDRLRRLPLATWTYASTPEGGWVVRYRLEGDLADSEVAVAPVARRVEGRWRLADTGQLAPALWDLEGLQVARGTSSLVLVGGPAETAAPLAADLAGAADAAVAAVTAAWPRPWAGRLVVVVPGDWSAGLRLAGADGGGSPYGTYAALTTSVDPPGRGDPRRVLVRADAVAGADAATRQVLLTHEAVHVATGPDRLPLWLSEGFADEVAYRGLDDATVRRALPALLRAARAGELPAGPPADADFAAGGGVADRAYEGAHLLVRTLVRDAGPEAVAGAYAAALDDPARLDAVLLERLGLDTAAATARWRDEIVRLAGSSG